MMCKLVLVLGLVIFINQLHELEACQCQSTSVWDEATGQNIGNCRTQYHNKYWCYVNRLGGCADVRESRKRPGIYYAYSPCPQNQHQGPEPFMPNYEEVNYGSAEAEIDYYDYNY